MHLPLQAHYRTRAHAFKLALALEGVVPGKLAKQWRRVYLGERQHEPEGVMGVQTDSVAPLAVRPRRMPQQASSHFLGCTFVPDIAEVCS